MCSYIVGNLFERPEIDTLYFFCNSQEEESVCIQILRTLSLYLLRRPDVAASLIANEFVYQAKNCGLQELRILLPQLLEISSYTRSLIDGVDECPKHRQKAILKELQELCLCSNSWCKTLFSLRNYRQFWTYHLLSYCSNLGKENKRLSHDISVQLSKFLNSSEGADEMPEDAQPERLACCFDTTSKCFESCFETQEIQRRAQDKREISKSSNGTWQIDAFSC